MEQNPHPKLEVIDIQMFRPWHWLSLAWQDMKHSPMAGVVHGLILAVVCGGLFWLARDDFAWIAAMVSVSMIIAPLLATGLYDISRRLERGEPATLADAFRGWTCGDKRLIHFGLLLALSSAGWMLCSAAFIHWMLPDSVHTPADFVRLVVLKPEFGLFELWVVVGALMAAPMFASTLVTLPLLMDHPTLTVRQAVMTSWRAVAMNPFAMACWAAILGLFTALGVVTAFVGLLVVVPLLGHASWHAYRDLVAYDPTAH